MAGKQLTSLEIWVDGVVWLGGPLRGFAARLNNLLRSEVTYPPHCELEKLYPYSHGTWQIVTLHAFYNMSASP